MDNLLVIHLHVLTEQLLEGALSLFYDVVIVLLINVLAHFRVGPNLVECLDGQHPPNDLGALVSLPVVVHGGGLGRVLEAETNLVLDLLHGLVCVHVHIVLIDKSNLFIVPRKHGQEIVHRLTLEGLLLNLLVLSEYDTR